MSVPTPKVDLRAVVGLLFPVLLMAACAVRSPAPPAETALTPPLIIDVRTPAEFQTGHIQDAVNVPYDRIEGEIGEYTTKMNRDILVYCRSGRRSEIALNTLRDMGYTRVTNGGGFEALQGQLSP